MTHADDLLRVCLHIATDLGCGVCDLEYMRIIQNNKYAPYKHIYVMIVRKLRCCPGISVEHDERM